MDTEWSSYHVARGTTEHEPKMKKHQQQQLRALSMITVDLSSLSAGSLAFPIHTFDQMDV